MAKNSTYYDADLAADLKAAALQIIEVEGPAAVSLRSLARGLGVSHAAPKNHFDDKAALFAAIAVDGFSGLSDALTATIREPGESALLEVGSPMSATPGSSRPLRGDAAGRPAPGHRAGGAVARHLRTGLQRRRASGDSRRTRRPPRRSRTCPR